jgi:peptidoglycan/xylan/chitin deacetylase (PgdA/CDA1 family)
MQDIHAMLRGWYIAVLVTALALAVAAGSAHAPARADSPWKRKPKPGAYTKWPLPAAGDSASGAPELIFTFDDGPHERYTPIILEELKKRGIQAIFFLVGSRLTKESPRKPARRALVDRILREGHIVANHSFDHQHLCKLSAAGAADQIDRTSAILAELAEMPIFFWRTPYGDYCQRLIDLLDARRIEHLHWDIDPMEWKDHDGERVAGTLRRKFAKVGRTNRRAVVLMHDTHRATAIAFPKAMAWLDQENARRTKAGSAPIRVVQASELVTELMDPAFSAWVRGSYDAGIDSLLAALRGVIP